MWALMRKYLIAGLLVWVPILVTVFVIRFIVTLMDQSINLLPARWQPEAWIGVNIPGLGLVMTLLILFFTGMLVTNFLGNKIVALWDQFVNRIPLIRSLYAGVKQVMQTLFSPNGTAFRKVLLVEFPRKGLWSIAFQTAETNKVLTPFTEAEMVSIFIPTTPNPTSGFMMIVDKKDVIELNMTVDQGLKMVISLGVVQP